MCTLFSLLKDFQVYNTWLKNIYEDNYLMIFVQNHHNLKYLWFICTD